MTGKEGEGEEEDGECDGDEDEDGDGEEEGMEEEAGTLPVGVGAGEVVVRAVAIVAVVDGAVVGAMGESLEVGVARRADVEGRGRGS